MNTAPRLELGGDARHSAPRSAELKGGSRLQEMPSTHEQAPDQVGREQALEHNARHRWWLCRASNILLFSRTRSAHRQLYGLVKAMLRLGKNEREGAAQSLFENDKEFDSFYRREAPKLLQFLKRRIWIEEERADLVQEAFTRLVAATSSAARENPGSYVQGILRHLLADRARSWSRANAARLDETALPSEPELPDAALQRAQMQDQYRAAVDTLPAKTRQVFLLHRAEELPYRQIAEQLGISVRTVEWHIAQAVVRIGKSLSAHD